MADHRLVIYLRENLRAGYDKYTLGNYLLAAGHSPFSIREALAEVEQEGMPLPPKNEPGAAMPEQQKELARAPEIIPASKLTIPVAKCLQHRTAHSKAIKKKGPLHWPHIAETALVILIAFSALWIAAPMMERTVGAVATFMQVPLAMANISALVKPEMPANTAALVQTAQELLPGLVSNMACNLCEYREGANCLKASCCNDKDCDDQINTTADVCEAPGTQNARCVRSIIACGNKNCELGENCCLDCGCLAGMVCIENACITQNTPVQMPPAPEIKISPSLQKKPVLEIISPREMEEVAGNDLTITFVTKDITFGQEKVIFLLDEDAEVAHAVPNPYTYHNIAVGSHTLETWLADPEGKKYTNPESMKTIHFSVAQQIMPQPPLVPIMMPSAPPAVG